MTCGSLRLKALALCSAALENKAARTDNFGTGGLSDRGAANAHLLIRELRLKGDQAQASRPTERLHAVGHLKLVVDVCQVEIHSSLRDVQHIRHFFAGSTFDDQGEHLDLALGQLDRILGWPLIT